jgi:hypothetical protein
MQLGVFANFDWRWRGILSTNPGSEKTVNRIVIGWMKYNNGRFFANAEVSNYDRVRRRDMNPNGPLYLEDVRYTAEIGFVAGPAKLSLLGSWAGGADRRQGQLLDRCAGAFGGGTILGNNIVYRPYSYLMVHSYAGGNGAFSVTNGWKGNFVDGWFLGARLDYAVAANLNTYVTACYAERVSQSYGMGFMGPAGATGKSSLQNAIGSPILTHAILGPHAFFNRNAPAIPDLSLGWEFDAGFDWKLLEGLALKLDTAIWLPGKWFSYAYVDRSVAGWSSFATHVAGNAYGTNPGRDIDPVVATSLRFEANF